MEVIRGIKTDIPECINYLKTQKENYVTIAPDLSFMNNVAALVKLINNCVKEGIEIVEFVPCRPLDAMNSYEVELYHVLQRYNIRANWNKIITRRR